MTPAWLQFDDPDLLGRACASHLGRAARQAVAARRMFTLALSGGRSPLPLFRALGDPGLFPPRLWAATHLFFADERQVPPDHPDSNHRLVREHLLELIPLPIGNVHRLPGELPPEQAARIGEKELRTHCPLSRAGLPVLDLIVLGMGADGHTASLFPGSTPPDGYAAVAPVPPPTTAVPAVARLTLTPATLDAAREIVFLVQGADKHPLLDAIRAGDTSRPAGRVATRPQSWYVTPPLSFTSSHGRPHGRF